MKLRTSEKIINNVILAVFALFALIPLIGVLLSSVTPSSENKGGFAVPSRIVWANYAQAWTRGHIGRYMLTSFVVTVAVMVLTGFMSILAGYAFARLRFHGANLLFGILVIGLALPSAAFIIPLYYNMRDLGLTDTIWSLILPQTAQSLAFSTYWMRNQFRTFPNEVIEAARLDGAGDFRLLWQIMVPPSLAPIMTMMVLIMMWTWNEFLIPLVMIVKDSLKTAPLGLATFQGQHLTDYSLLSAAGVLVALPIAVFYFLMQRHFINGMVGGISTK